MANYYLFTAGKQGYDSSAYHYGYVYYTVTETTTSVTVTLNSVGERMTVNNDAYSSYSYSGTSTVTGTLVSGQSITASNSNTRRCTSRDTYISFGGTAVSATYNKGTSATTKRLNISWVWTAGNVNYSAYVDIAIPALPTYTVSYNANGGTNAPASQTKTHGVSLTLTSSTPTAPSGFTFQGWGTSSTDTTVDYSAGGSYTANASITLYAIWRKAITLSYSLNGGSGGPSAETKYVYARTGSTNPSATFTIPSAVPTKTDYRFTGWVYNSTTYQPASQIELSNSATLTAQWAEDYVAPRFGTISAYRTDQNGSTNNGVGQYGKLSVTWTKATLAGTAQTTTFTATYKEHGTADTPTTITTSTGTSIDGVFGGGNLSADKQYDIYLTLSCSGHPDVTYITFISTENFTIDVNPDGTAIGLLQVAPDNDSGVFIGGDIIGDGDVSIGGGLSVNNDVSVGNDIIIDGSVDLGGLAIANDNGAVSINSKRVADFVILEDSASVTSGGTGTWYYRIWKSGWQEAWYHGSIVFSSESSSVSGWYRSTQKFALPLSFADDATITTTGSYTGRVYTNGGMVTDNGTKFEAQILGGQTLSARTNTNWNVYVAGYGRT